MGMPIPPAPKTVSISVLGLKVTGVKNYRVNIFDAWKDKGVMLKQPLVKYEPPKNIDAMIKLGIAQSLNKQEEEVKKQLNTNRQDVILNSLIAKAGGAMSINAGGAMFSWGDLENWWNGVVNGAKNAAGSAGNAITSGAGSIVSGAENAAGAVSNGIGDIGNDIKNFAGDIGKIWNSLINLSDLVDEMYTFMKSWKQTSSELNNRLMNLTATNEALTRSANQLILENRQFYADLSKSMNESLAKYFDNLTFNLLKYGQVDVPTSVVGTVSVAFKNLTAMPISASIPDLKIISGPYTLHKGAYMINMLPFETDVGNIPFEINGVEESKYILDAKKSGKAIPIVVTGTLITPVSKESINISKNVYV